MGAVVVGPSAPANLDSISDVDLAGAIPGDVLGLSDDGRWVPLHGLSGSSFPNLYIGPTEPTEGVASPYVWLQTGLGASGTDFTLWLMEGP